MFTLVLVFTIGALAGALASAAATVALLRRRAAKAAADREAERRLADLGSIASMTSGLAHEIKNPLSTLGLNAQLLAEAIDDLPLPEADQGRLVRRIGAMQRETERLGGILTDFLEYAGELHVTTRPVDLTDLAGELTDFALPQAEQAGVRLRLDAPQGPVLAQVDPALLKQALLNLVLNAIQAMQQDQTESDPPNRDLLIRVARERDAGVAWASIHVIDTGPGMPADTAARIFEPYFTTKPSGSGLGLPTTKRIIEAHRGEIRVFTEVGKGTDFAIVLPALESPPA